MSCFSSFSKLEYTHLRAFCCKVIYPKVLTKTRWQKCRCTYSDEYMTPHFIPLDGEYH